MDREAQASPYTYDSHSTTILPQCLLSAPWTKHKTGKAFIKMGDNSLLIPNDYAPRNVPALSAWQTNAHFEKCVKVKDSMTAHYCWAFLGKK